jgi:hypothetical protein
MDAFAVGVLIFLLLCIIGLILSIVFFPGTPAKLSTVSTVSTVKSVPVSTNPGPNDNNSQYNRRYTRPNYIYYSNINVSTNLTFLNELYEELARSRGGVTTVTGSDSNVYINNLLSGASGASTGSSSNASTSNASFSDYNSVGNNVNAFSDYDLAGYSPY